MTPTIRLGPSLNRKWSVVLHGINTSITLEPAFHEVLKQMAREAELSFAAFLAAMKPARGQSLASCARLAALAFVRERAKARLTQITDPV